MGHQPVSQSWRVEMAIAAARIVPHIVLIYVVPLSFYISKKSETGQPAFYEKLEVWKPRSKRAPVVAVVKFHKLGVFVTQRDT